MFRTCSLALILLASQAHADITGPIRVIDGDTIAIGAQTIRLHGIDAPENGQPCTSASETFDCGGWVTTQITALFENQTATCTHIDTDRYDRMVAQCNVGGTDLNAWIVGEGLAWAYLRYSDAYALDEKNAAVAGLGIHGFEIENPATYRAVQAAAPAPPATCATKGNITDNGRIYHLPHNRDYGRTRINEQKGERWFCTEDEALSAGWRAALN